MMGFLLLFALVILLAALGIFFYGLIMMVYSDSLFTNRRATKPDVVKQFCWTFPIQPELARHIERSRFSIRLSINRARYDHYRQQTSRNLSPYQFDSYVTPETPEVQLLARRLMYLARQRGYRRYDLLCLTLAFIQQTIHYAHDLSPKTGELVEFPKYPLETLMEQQGDCEDQVILMASLLQKMEFDAALIILPTHVALGVAGVNGLHGAPLVDSQTGVTYHYTETTVNGWLPGEIPADFQPDVDKGDYDILPIGKNINTQAGSTPQLYNHDADSGQDHTQSLAPSDVLA